MLEKPTQEYRIEAIDRLIADDMDSILNQGYDDYLYSMLLSGFKGYENMETDVLTQELANRNIVLGKA